MDKEFRRARLYDYIERFTIAHNKPPTLKELAAEMETSYATVRDDLAALKARGCVDWIPNTPWSIRITGPYRLAAKTG